MHDMTNIKILNEFSIKDIFEPKDTLGELLELAVYAAIGFIIAFIVIKIEKKLVAKRLIDKKSIKLRFTQNIIKIAIIAIAAVWVLTSATATANFGKVLFQGTTILAAVVGLAAGPVISDLFCGLMISINKPFDIGDRVELDNGTCGVVTDITARHVVITVIDTVVAVIPNSKVNSCVIRNMSWNMKVRSVNLNFNVAYGTDVEKAMAVIKQAVEESPYTVPAWKGKNEYGPVYFISYADSSLVMSTTIYFPHENPTEKVKSDVNLRVNNAFAEAGIEIPFTYVNVVMKKDAE